jgi:hypothetical protein
MSNLIIFYNLQILLRLMDQNKDSIGLISRKHGGETKPKLFEEIVCRCNLAGIIIYDAL